MLMPSLIRAKGGASVARLALCLLGLVAASLWGSPVVRAQEAGRGAQAEAPVDPLVSEVQRRLAEQGYDPGPVDGVPSPRARDAVRAYQRDAGLAETGLFTQSLLERLRNGQERPPAGQPPLKFSSEIPPATQASPPTPAPPPATPTPAPTPRPKPSPPQQARPEPPPPPPAAPRPEAAAEEKARERGAQEGTLEIFLAWSSTSDIDLHVRCPTGGNIWFRNMEDCGGRLDLDTNALGTPRVADPVEHVVFAAPPEGSYRVEIANCELMGPPEAFRLWVVYKGKVIAQSRNEVPVDPGWSWPCGGPQSYLTFRIPE